MAQTPDPTPLEDAEVRSFVTKVYRELFDSHAPLDLFLASLDDDELEMRFPEETVRGHAGFQRWYERIVNTFFDETHTIRELEVARTLSVTDTVDTYVPMEACSAGKGRYHT